MTNIKYLLIVIIAVFFTNCNAQNWPKYYGEPGRYDFSEDIEVSYDNGYYIAGNFTDENGALKSSWIIKTDRNGNILWDKVLVNSDFSRAKALTVCNDGGIIICGLIRQQGDEGSNPYVAKLDACGEKVWCRVFSENIGDAGSKWASDVKETSTEDIIVLVNQYGNHPINTMHLFKLNANGEVLWRNPYASAYQHPGSILPLGESIYLTTNQNILICGSSYWEDPWNPGGPMGIRPTFTLVDSIGTEKWVLPFGRFDTIYGDAYNVIEKNENEFVAIASKWPDDPQIKPLFIKFDNTGTILGHQTINVSDIDTIFSEGAFENLILKDSSYYLSGVFEIYSTGVGPLITAVVDTNLFNEPANITDRVIFDHQYYPYDLDSSLNGKFLNTATYQINSGSDIALSKILSSLENDTLDPGTYTYDSLCTVPGLPQSGFISLDDCDLFVDIDEIPNAKQYQEKIRWIPIKAFPNPVKDGKLILEFENTEHHQNMVLSCCDNFGRQIHSQKIYKGQQDTDLDVSGWSPGIYIAVVYSNGGARGKVKFVVE